MDPDTDPKHCTKVEKNLGISCFAVLDTFFSAVNFFNFFVIKTLDSDWIRIRIGIQSKMLDPDQMNADPTVAYHVHYYAYAQKLI